jgi:nicotinate-nucleotide pyrophosphorylase (carboxylating)
LKISGEIEALISLAISEDIGSGDVTTNSCIPPELLSSANIVAREDFVVCGQQLVDYVFRQVDSSLHYSPFRRDGESVVDGEILGSVKGPMRSILTAERCVLNFMQRLSGVSTQTASLVQLIEGTGARLFDTRKTTPGWRRLEKYAVSVGGGFNHRVGLFDAVLIKNNHVDALGGDVAETVSRCRAAAGEGIEIEVEVRSLSELLAALEAGPDSVLLDNMSPQKIRECVSLVRSHAGDSIVIEASGGINRETLRSYADSGVDRISLGLLTHSVRSVDISLWHDSNES